MDRRWAIGVTPWTETVTWQRFSVPYEYPVAFTRGVFEPSNPLLADVLARREPERRNPWLAAVDWLRARAED